MSKTTSNIHHISMKGNILAIQPLSTAPMSPDREQNMAEKYPEGGKRTSRLPRLLVEGESGSREWTVYFPAAGIRGILRRVSRDIVQQLTGQHWNLDVNRYLSIGGVTSSGSEASYNIARQTELRKNMPLLGLFGASSDMGNTWLSGSLSLGHAIPNVPIDPSIVTGIRRDDIRHNPEKEIQFLTDESVSQLAEVANAERQSAKLRRDLKGFKSKLSMAKRAKYADLVAGFEKDIESTEAEIKKLSGLSGDVSVQMPLDGYETIPPGSQLAQTIRLRYAFAEEIGLFLVTLDRFALDPIIGAKTAHGCGEISGRWDVRERLEGEGFDKEALTLELVSDEGLMINGESIRENSWSAPFVKSFEDAMKAIKDTPIAEVVSHR